MYASFFAMALGQALLLNNWIAGFAALVAVGVLYRVRTPNEERMMLESFGDEYRAYMRRTGGIVPRATLS
jgi:protein-S-isoprenylcysteine O-methyltransferase Ste14